MIIFDTYLQAIVAINEPVAFSRVVICPAPLSVCESDKLTKHITTVALLAVNCFTCLVVVTTCDGTITAHCYCHVLSADA